MKKVRNAALIIAIIISVFTVAVICARGIIIQKLSKNEKVNDAVEKAAQALDNEETKKEIDEVINQLISEGYLDSEKVNTYREKYNAESESTEKKEVKGSDRVNPGEDGYDDVVQARKKERLEDKIGDTEIKMNSEKPKSKTERVLSAMTPSEAAFAMSVYNRVDVGHVQSLMKTDRAAAKAYVTERLSSAEISRAFELYSKYAYLLKD